MNDRATLIASLTAPPEPAELEALAGQADGIELRADLTGDIPAGRLRDAFPGRLLYTLRSREEGGECDLEPAARAERLAVASDGFDLVDLEAERDLDDDLLARVEPARRLISWHGPLPHQPDLEARLGRMTAVDAAWYKLVPEVSSAAQALWPLDLLLTSSRRDVIAFAAGEGGSWSRLLAPRLGAPLVFAATGGRPAGRGQISLATLRRDYGLPALGAVRRLYGVVGRPVAHSLSPRLHNGLYRQLGVEALYLPFHVEEFGTFWLDLVEGEDLDRLELPLGGLSVTAPFKAIALAVAGASSPLAERVGAANTLVRRRGVWEAEATDGEGVVLPLRAQGVALEGVEAAIVGAGGAGRAAAVGLEQAGARVCLVNRTADRARQAGRRLGMPAMALAELDPGRFDLIVNATPVGRDPADEPPFDVGRLGAAAVVVDMVYAEGRTTALIEAAQRRGLVTVDGREVLLHQAFRQFRLMTGREVPADEARRLLGLEVGQST